MKKKILLVVLAVVMLSFVGCDRGTGPYCDPLCEYPNVMIIGRIVEIGLPCRIGSEVCLDLMIIAVVNNAGTFVFYNDGILNGLPEHFGVFSVGDRVTFCGKVRKAIGYDKEFYYLEVSKVIG